MLGKVTHAVIPATQEAEIQRIIGQGQSGQKFSEMPSEQTS
jgi:hypothetical protein